LSLEKLADRIIETDVLVVGGGTAGCPLAAKAAEAGLKVTIVEKSKTERSGNVGHGVDAYGIFANGISVTGAVKLWANKEMHSCNGPGHWVNSNIDYALFKRGFWALEELERLGLPMRWDNGELYWFPHLLRGPGIKSGLRVHWQNIKPKMTKMCKERGVQILDRVMVVDLLTDGDKVVGATAFNTRTGQFVLIKAKAVVLAAGMLCRCFEPETPTTWKYKFRYHYCPASISGDGFAMAYRAGAKLVNMDINGWGFRIRDDSTISFGNFPNNDGLPAKIIDWKGNPVSWNTFHTVKGYHQAEQDGTAPFYYSLNHLPEDFQKRLELNYNDEWLLALKLCQERGFNPRTHWWESGANKPLQFMMPQGAATDEHFSTTVKGLYAVGDNAAGVGGAYGACISGLVVGEEVGDYISAAGNFKIDEEQVAQQKKLTYQSREVEPGMGPEPMDVECAIRYICERYVGNFRSEGMMREGVRRFDSLKKQFGETMAASNPHYQMRALEVRNIMDLAELHLDACMNRKETRGNFVRTDYPQQDPAWDNKVTYQRLDNGKRVIEVETMPYLRPEYEEPEEVQK
jgi:succinate dehydrogenase/fumarate reductase flavoprotein subunit